MRDLIRFLIYLSGDYSYWGKQILRYHIRRRQQFLAIERKTMKQGHINFGMAHGVAGPLVALAKAKRQGIQEMYLEEAIWKLFGLYEEWESGDCPQFNEDGEVFKEADGICVLSG